MNSEEPRESDSDVEVEEEQAGNPASTRCLYCAEGISPDAKKCRFCGEWQKPIYSASSSSKDRWDKAEAFGKTVSLVLIPIVLALLANEVNKSLKKSDVDLQMVQLAASVLQAKPTESNKELRGWATKVIDHHAQVRMSQPAMDELLTEPLPMLLKTDSRALTLADFPTIGLQQANVMFRAVDKSGQPVSGYKVLYEEDRSNTFGTLIINLGPREAADTSVSIFPGDYYVWCRKDGEDGPRKKVTISYNLGLIYTIDVPVE